MKTSIQNQPKPSITEKRSNNFKYLIWNSIRHLFVMKASIPNLGYINCYSLSSPRPVKSPSTCARHNCQKICSWLWKPKTILEIRKKGTILWVINNPIIYKFSRTLLTTERRPTGWWFLAVDLSPTFLNTGTTDKTFQESGKQDAFRQILKIKLKII